MLFDFRIFNILRLLPTRARKIESGREDNLPQEC